jgi:hypothetical protein
MADKQATTAPSEPPPKLPNCPLPRELCDKIYGYLLDSEYTRIRRTYDNEEHKSAIRDNRTGPRAYHFHTNVLAVNHTIHKEAEELMYKRNIFIVISYQWQALNKSRGGLFWVPVVSNTHAARMQHHSIRVHVSPGTYVTRAARALSGTAVPVRSYILLARDIDAFCSTLQSSVASANAPSIRISGQPSSGITLQSIHTDRQGRAGKSTQFKCDFRRTKYPSISDLSQQNILTSLASIIGPSQRMVFTGDIRKDSRIEDRKRIMSPTLVCPPAVLWSIFKFWIKAKDVADASIDHDDLRLVLLQYMYIEYTINELVKTHAQVNLEPPFVVALRTFRLEITTNILIGWLKLGLIDDFSNGCEKMCLYVHEASEKLGESWKVPDQLQAYIDNLRLWFDLYQPIAALHPGTKTVKDAVNALTQGEPGPHQIHDAQILMRHGNQNDIVTEQHLPVDQCSAVQLPFPGTNFLQERC